MRKLFSLIAAVLFAGSMMAETSSLVFTAKCNGSGTADDGAVWTVTSDGSESNFDNTCGIHYGTNSASVQYLQLETSSISGTITEVVVNARDAQACASLTVNVGSTTFAGTATATNTSTNYTFTGSAKGNIVVRLDRGSAKTKALYIKSVIVTYTPASSSDPVITAENVSLGYIRFEGNSYTTTTTLSVTGANLSQGITASTESSKLEILTSSVPSTGGDFSIKVTAAGGALEEIVTLTSGTETATAKILGRLIKRADIQGEDVTLLSDSNTVDSVTVNTLYGMKAGTSKKAGSMRLRVPANASKLYFFAAAWTGAPGDISISAPSGVTLTSSNINDGKITLLADAGIAGTETDYLLQSVTDEASCLCEIDLSGVSAETDITLASGTAQRFAIWGAKYELAAAPVQYGLYVADDIENGSISLDKTAASVGETVTVTITPDAGYELDHLTATGGDLDFTVNGNTATFIMPGRELEIGAVFVATTPAEYNVFISGSVAYGNIVADKNSYAEGETVTLTITPDDNYELDELTGTGLAASDITINGNTATFIMPGHEVTIEATFVPVPAGCDWSSIAWFNVGIADTDENYDQFKICKEGEYPNVVNIQTAPWADNNKGIYVNFPSAEIGTISLPAGQYKVDGAGILLYLSAFTAKETEVTIQWQSVDRVFTVYNDKGTDTPTAIDNTNVVEKAQKFIENGQLFIIKNGVKYNAQGAVIK